MYEIFLLEKCIDMSSWEVLIKRLIKYTKINNSLNIYAIFDGSFIKFYLNTKMHLTASLDKVDNFLFKECEEIKYNKENRKKSLLFTCSTMCSIKESLYLKRGEKLEAIDIKIKHNLLGKIKYKINMITDKHYYRICFNNPSNILTVDFNTLPNTKPSGIPKYLDISKNLSLLSDNKINSLFGIDTFPFVDGKFYLDQGTYDFNKHSLILGSSGSGKSKFLASFIKNTLKNNSEYKIVVIDPHAALEDDIGGLGTVINFIDNYINLFASSTDIIINIELLLELITSLIGSSNTKVERVLRHSIYILLIDKSFNFNTLKKVILDIEYRNDLLNKHKGTIPTNIVEFFASEFNEIKTKSYMDAISPIISLVDELSLIPVFNTSVEGVDLFSSISSDNLLLFSLDRTKLGDKVTKTISGLIMEQLLTLVERRVIKEHIIFIVDEISVVENPILSIFLSEARKYNLSLILSGQYFNQVSEDLKNSIFANVLNYYIFRVSLSDATTINKNISMKIPISDTEETKVNLLSSLKDRECIIRVSKNGVLLPPLKGKTLDFVSVPKINDTQKKDKHEECVIKKKKEESKFSINTTVSLKDILTQASTSRKDLKNER